MSPSSLFDLAFKACKVYELEEDAEIKLPLDLYEQLQSYTLVLRKDVPNFYGHYQIEDLLSHQDFDLYHEEEHTIYYIRVRYLYNSLYYVNIMCDYDSYCSDLLWRFVWNSKNNMLKMDYRSRIDGFERYFKVDPKIVNVPIRSMFTCM